MISLCTVPHIIGLRAISTWELIEAFHLNHDPEVDAWVKNDHLNFEILC